MDCLQLLSNWSTTTSTEDELVTSYRDFTLQEQGEYVLDREKALAFLSKDSSATLQQQTIVSGEEVGDRKRSSDVGPPVPEFVKRSKPEKIPTSKKRAYNLFLGDDGLTLKEIGETIAKRDNPVSVTNVCKYICTEYQTNDAERLRDKLGLTNAIIERTYLVMEAVKIERARDRENAPNNKEYEESLHKSLGGACTSPELACKILSKLYRDLVLCPDGSKCPDTVLVR